MHATYSSFAPLDEKFKGVSIINTRMTWSRGSDREGLGVRRRSVLLLDLLALAEARLQDAVMAKTFTG